MVHKIFIGVLFILLAASFGQIGEVSFTEGRVIPKTLNYQGYLTDTLGNPITDSLNMKVKIYDAETDGSLLWAEIHTDVPIEQGVFNVLLGSVNPIPDSVFIRRAECWLELDIGPQTLSPRTRIASVGYAYTAAYADTAEYAKSVAPDIDWVRGTPDSVLFTANYLGIARGSADNMLYGDSVHTHTNLGVACTTGTSGEDFYYCTVGGGRNNTASNNYATVAGGYSGKVNAYCGGILSGYNNLTGDEAEDTAAVVVGGWNNKARGKYSFIGGGKNNTADSSYASVASGLFNTASDDYATISGGYNNDASGRYATVSGGWRNTANDDYTTVAGGRYNTANDWCATVAGGYDNIASGVYATVAGGFADTVKANYGGVLSGYCNLAGDEAGDTAAVVVGGWENSATGKYSFVGGGKDNNASDNYANVLGGFRNTASGWSATVAGGSYNTADEPNATVAGGNSNTASGYYATVAGGECNAASVEFATVAGGFADTVLGHYGGILSGYSNLAGDEVIDTAAIVAGGWGNSATAKYSFIGCGAYNSASNSFAMVAGGWGNTASGYSATVAGGYNNTASGINAVVGGGYSNTASGSDAAVAGGESNTASGDEATVAGGFADTAAADCGFATNYSTKVLTGHDNSAAFTTSHTIAANQVRAASFSTGTLVFTMDHPSDPNTEILNQYAMGSDEAILFYRGAVTLDANGKAVVNLPDYFDKINRTPMIQLTGVGSSDAVFVAEDVRGNSFVIGGKPGMKVYWTVTAERKDIHAEIARTLTPVEQPKTGDLIGHSLDDDALIGIYDELESKRPGVFKFRTAEGRRVHEESKRMIEQGTER